MHMWGEEGVDWQGIGDAACYIGGFCQRWGRIPVSDMKEKYGTVRVYLYFGFFDWGWKSYLNWLVVPYQHRIYRLAYKKAIAKWPHLREEILCGADWQELLGGL